MKHFYPFVTAALAALTAFGGETAHPDAPNFMFTVGGQRSAVLAAPDASANPFLTSLPTLNSSIIARRPDKVMRADAADGDALPEVYGVVISSNPYVQRGLYRVPVREGDAFTMVSPQLSQVSSGAEKDGIFYANNIVSRYGQPYCTYYYVMDMAAWQMQAQCQSSNFLGAGRDMATDPTTGEIYGCFVKTHACAGYVLAKMDMQVQDQRTVVPVRETICDLDNMLTALFFTADGQLYGIDLITGPDENGKDDCQSASLYKIDKTTGAMTLIGDTGAKPYYVSSATCDIYGDGKVYWAVKDINNVGSLYTVDLATGSATKLFDFPANEEVVAMFTPLRPAPKSPAMPSEVKVDFPEGRLTGTLSVNVPDKYYDGTDASGLCSAEFYVNGQKAGEGRAVYGGEISCAVEVASAGNYTFSARLKNDAGMSGRVQTVFFVGTGTPATPVPVLSNAGGKNYLVWEPVDKSSYGGYINPAEFSYSVRRSDGTIVAEGLKVTQFIEQYNPTDLEAVCYEVRTDWKDEITSGWGKSNTLTLGKIIPPFLEEFNDPYRISATGPWIDYQADGSTLGHWFVNSMSNWATASTGFGLEDSWLISPVIALEAGKTYFLGFDAWASYVTKPVEFSVMLGTAQVYQALTQEIVPTMQLQVNQANSEYIARTFTVDRSGDYYLGIHCTTPNGGPNLLIDNLRLEEAGEAGRPGKPASVTVNASTKGSLTANVTVVAPSKTYEGQPLTGTMDIDLSRDGELLKTFSGVTPGQSVEFSETLPAAGDYIYTALARNSVGTGLKAEGTGYVGWYEPRPASELKLSLSEGEFTMEWKPDYRDRKWNTLDPSEVTFTLLAAGMDGSTEILAENIPGTQTTYTFPDKWADGPAKFVQVGVATINNCGVSSVTASNVIATGKPYATPYDESFSGTPAGIMYGTTLSGTTEWAAMTDSDLDGFASADGDNGYMVMFAGYQNSQGGLVTANIDLRGLEFPGLTMKVHNLTIDGNANLNQIMVAVSDGSGTFTPVRAQADIIGSLGMPGEWVKYNVSLEQYRGKVVQILIAARAVNYTVVMIDDIHIGNIPAADLSALSLYGDSEIEEGVDGQYTVMLLNNGYNIADYSVDLLRDGKVVGTQERKGLANGVFDYVTFADRPDVNSKKKVSYRARVNLEGDTDPADNKLGPVGVSVVLPAYPTVDDLTAEAAETGVALKWTEPSKDYTPNPVTESFEGKELYSDVIEGWTTVDADDLPISMGSASGLFGDYVSGSKASFFVVESDKTKNMIAHSGDRFLVKFAPQTGFGDDWLISPELNGCAQTVSVWARTYSDQTPENLELLYSTGSLDPADFISVRKLYDLPVLWTRISADLPEGAKYLAVRSRSNATFMLHVDDIRYIGVPLDLTLAGYNVWREGERITSAPVTSTGFVDADGQPGMKYRVSAVYDAGESVPGSEAMVESGLIPVTDGSAAVTVTPGIRSVTVTGAQGMAIEVWGVDGRSVRSLTCSACVTRIPLPAGAYVVKAGTVTAKVLVK